MVDVELLDESEAVLAHGARPSVLTHKSAAVWLLQTAVSAVPLALGLRQEEEYHTFRYVPAVVRCLPPCCCFTHMFGVCAQCNQWLHSTS